MNSNTYQTANKDLAVILDDAGVTREPLPLEIACALGPELALLVAFGETAIVVATAACPASLLDARDAAVALHAKFIVDVDAVGGWRVLGVARERSLAGRRTAFVTRSSLATVLGQHARPSNLRRRGPLTSRRAAAVLRRRRKLLARPR